MPNKPPPNTNLEEELRVEVVVDRDEEVELVREEHVLKVNVGTVAHLPIFETVKTVTKREPVSSCRPE